MGIQRHNLFVTTVTWRVEGGSSHHFKFFSDFNPTGEQLKEMILKAHRYDLNHPAHKQMFEWLCESIDKGDVVTDHSNDECYFTEEITDPWEQHKKSGCTCQVEDAAGYPTIVLYDEKCPIDHHKLAAKHNELMRALEAYADAPAMLKGEAFREMCDVAGLNKSEVEPVNTLLPKEPEVCTCELQCRRWNPNTGKCEICGCTYREPIPDGVYYSGADDNFHQQEGGRSMGTTFYSLWGHRKREFPGVSSRK
jgi:hypothetical protein